MIITDSEEPGSMLGNQSQYLSMTDIMAEQSILEELRGKELEICLLKFLGHIDYLAMADFFLTFRSHLRPLDLFSVLRNKYESSLEHSPIAGRHLRVRSFVALRHWILNYYIDDFFLNEELSTKVEVFVGSLGGVGADEISTESRIAKELRRTWQQQKDLYASIKTTKHFKVFDHGNLIRTRHFSMQLDANLMLSTGPETTPVIVAALKEASRPRVTSLEQRIDLELASLQDMQSGISQTEGEEAFPMEETDFNDFNGFGRNSSLSLKRSPRLSRLDLMRRLSKHVSGGEVQSNDCPEQTTHSPIRTLKRRPGGILRNAQTIADLIPSVRYSDGSDSQLMNDMYSFSKLNRTYSNKNEQHSMPRGALATHKTFVHDLATMFKDDTDDAAEEQVSIVLQDTLAKLEGRATAVSKKRKSISDQSTGLAAQIAEGDQMESIRPQTSSSEKRRKHTGCPELAVTRNHADFVDTDPLYEMLDSKLNSNYTTGILTESRGSTSSWPKCDLEKASDDSPDLRPSSSSMVSIIEALAIQPLPSITARSTQDSTTLLTRLPYTSFVLQHNEAQLCKCLMTVEKAVFLELDWLDLTSCSWSSKSTEVEHDWRDVVAEDIHATRLILARVNICTAWIVAEILYTTQMEERAKLISKFIDIAQLCRDHNNLSTVVQIVQALQHPAICRLSKTWQLLHSDSSRTWSRLHGLCDNRGGWRTLKAVQERILLNPEAVVVPFMGPYLSDLLATRVSSRSITAKMQASAATIKTLMEMLNRVNITEDDTADRTLIDQLVWIRGIRDEHAETLSRLCEP